jgi:hypothetical protein
MLFWVVTPCSSEKQRFRGTCQLHLQTKCAYETLVIPYYITVQPRGQHYSTLIGNFRGVHICYSQIKFNRYFDVKANPVIGRGGL